MNPAWWYVVSKNCVLQRRGGFSRHKPNMWWFLYNGWMVAFQLCRSSGSRALSLCSVEDKKHNGSWYCLRPEPNTNRKPCTHRHVTDSYLILGLKGRTSNGKSYFKFEVSLHHAASPWVFCSSKSSFIVTEDDILRSVRRITECEGS